MAGVAGRAALMIKILQRHRRVSVRGLQQQTGLSRETVYRYVRAMAAHLPVRVSNGVVVLDTDPAADHPGSVTPHLHDKGFENE